MMNDTGDLFDLLLDEDLDLDGLDWRQLPTGLQANSNWPSNTQQQMQGDPQPGGLAEAHQQPQHISQPPSHLGQAAAWGAQQQQQHSPVFASAEAESRYTDTAALVAQAVAQMHATPTDFGAAQMPLQHVVSATSHQLQEMFQASAHAHTGAMPASAGMPGSYGVTAYPQQQQQHVQLPQQQLFQQQQQHLVAPTQQHQEQQQGLPFQQPAQHSPGQQQQQQPAFSASTFAKAASIAAAGAGRDSAKMFAPPPAAALLSAAPSAPGFLPTTQCDVGLQPLQTLLPAYGAAVASVTAAVGPDPWSQAQGLAVPPQLKGVMLTPAGAMTGVAVGPNLLHWVTGLQHLASQQQEVRAARSKAKAAKKKDKVAEMQVQLASKQAQLESLSLENMALVAKARALEQLVKSAGDDVSLMEEQLASLCLKQETAEDGKQAAVAAAAAVAALRGEAVWPPFQQQQQQQQPTQQQQQQPQTTQAQGPPESPAQQQQQRSRTQFKRLHEQVLQELMDTPLDDLEHILGGLGPPGPAAAAAAAGQAQQPGAGTGTGAGHAAAASGAGAGVAASAAAAQAADAAPVAGSDNSPGQSGGGHGATAVRLHNAALSDSSKQQQQEQELSPQQILYQEWSPTQQQQQGGGSAEKSSGSGTQARTQSSGLQQTSGNSTGQQSSLDDVSSPTSDRQSSFSDPALHGDLLGTAAAAAAAARAAAAGTGGGLLLAGSSGAHQQLFEAAAMASSSAFKRRARQLQEKLPEIQVVHKRVVLQLMPLLLQVQQERIQHNLAAANNSSGQQQGQDGQQQEQQLLDTPAMQQLTRVMLQYSKDIHTFAIAHRVSTYELYTLNIESGVLGQPPPAGHWKRVAGMLKDRLSPQALADLCIARQLYSSTLMRIKQQRQLLVLQLAQLISKTHSRTTEGSYKTDSLFQSVEGLHCEGALVLDAIEKSMRKEYTLEGVYQWMTHHIIPMHVLAELVVHSYPYKADIHMTLQELMRDQPMPALTALQQLQLRQLQEQQAALLAAQHQQQQSLLLQQQQQAAAAALVAQQQQQAAGRLQVLQEQRSMLAAGVMPAYGLHGGMPGV